MGAVHRMGRLIISGFTYYFCQQSGSLLQPLLAEIIGDTKKAAMLYGIASVLNLVAQFVCLPSLGAFGDAYGRKKLMVISSVGLTIGTICFAVVYSKEMIIFAFIGMIIQGVFGGFVANSQAMVVDMSTAEERPKFFAVYFILASASALILGPIVSGIIASVAGFHVALFIAAGVGLFCFIWTSLAVKETLPGDMRQKVTWERMNPCASFLMILKAEFLAGFLIIVFCVGFGMAAFNGIMYFYVHSRYGTGVVVYTLLLGLFALATIVSAAISPALCRKTSERLVSLWALFFGCTGLFTCGVAWTVFFFIVGLVVLSMLVLAQPAYLSILSKNSHVTIQAKLQAGVYSVGIASQACGVLTMSLLFANYSDGVPGLVFYVSSSVLVLGMLFAMYLFRKYPSDELRMYYRPKEASSKDELVEENWFLNDVVKQPEIDYSKTGILFAFALRMGSRW